MTTQANRSSTKQESRKARPAAKPKSRETKRAQLIRLFKAAKGVDVATLSQKLGWQRHSTRAALTGLRKAGFTIERVEGEAGRAASYRITAEPQAAQAK